MESGNGDLSSNSKFFTLMAASQVKENSEFKTGEINMKLHHYFSQKLMAIHK